MKVERPKPELTKDGRKIVQEIREAKAQLASVAVKPTKNGVFFMVAEKSDVEKALKFLGFTDDEIKDIMKRVEKA